MVKRFTNRIIKHKQVGYINNWNHNFFSFEIKFYQDQGNSVYSKGKKNQNVIPRSVTHVIRNSQTWLCDMAKEFEQAIEQ